MVYGVVRTPYPDPSTGSPAVEVRVSAEGPVVRRRDGRRSARSARSSGTRFAFGNADPSLVAFGDRVTRDDRTRSVTGDRIGRSANRIEDRIPNRLPIERRTRDTSYDVSRPPGEPLSVDIGRRTESLSLDRSTADRRCDPVDRIDVTYSPRASSSERRLRESPLALLSRVSVADAPSINLIRRY